MDTRSDRPQPPDDTHAEGSGTEDTVISGSEDTFVSERPVSVGGAGPDDDQAVTAEDPSRYLYQSQEMGRGGLGRVLAATDLHLGREVAVKELLHRRQRAE